MNEEQDLERRRTAYRQSGLAVARYTQGRTVPDLSLDRPETPVAPERSIRAWEVDLGSRTRHQVELEIIAQWAGPVAESRACFEDREPPQGWGAAGELLAALGRRVTRTADENDAYLEWLRRRALGLIEIPQIWAAIETLAAALLSRGTIPSAEASEIVAGVQRVARRRVGLAGFFRNPR
jgi:hypothetical protein